MRARGVSERDVEAVICAPTRGVYEPNLRDRREHFGYARDGRPLCVVTNRAGTVVVTVVWQ
jgi:hypothetical protein